MRLAGPPPMQRAPTISTLCLAFELAAFESLRLDVNRILGLAELTRDKVSDPHGRVTLDTRFRWWAAALRVSGDPALGLRVGESLSVGALGSFEYLLRNSESLSQVLARASEYMSLIDEAGVLELLRDGDDAILRVSRKGGHPNTPPEVHCLFAALLKVIRSEWAPAQLSAVRFAHAAPTDVAVFARHYGCPVRFGQDHNEILFPATLLAMGPGHADRNLARILEEHVRHLVSQLPAGDPFLLSVRTEMAKQIDRGAPRASTLARTLRMSERTLRRRLDSEGTSYNALLDELRRDLARRYVAETRDGFEAVADRLAFADASTFFRAFKRWTGMTPAQFRERAKEGAKVGSRVS